MRVTFLMTSVELERATSKANLSGFEAAPAYLRRAIAQFLGVSDDGIEVGIDVSDATTDPELDWLFAEADRVQSEMEKLRHVAQPSMDCPECGGSGQVASGSLGSMCVGCDGGGVVDAPFAAPLELPDITGFRARLKAPGADLAAMRLELTGMTATAASIAQKALAEPAPRSRGRLAGRGKRRTQQLVAASDDDFDDLETAGGDAGDDEG